MQDAIKREADEPLSGLPETPLNVPLYKQLPAWPLAKCLLRLTWERLLNTWCIWSGAFRSFRGHIRIQSPKEMPHQTVGVLLEWTRHGYVANTRTPARIESIRRLSAKYPWVDIVDHRIFLEGFDAGEQYVRGTLGIQIEQQDEIPS